jgi:hypothetical protein
MRDNDFDGVSKNDILKHKKGARVNELGVGKENQQKDRPYRWWRRERKGQLKQQRQKHEIHRVKTITIKYSTF